MKKLFRAILTLCTACILAVTAYGESASESGDWVYRVKDDGTAIIAVYSGDTANSDLIIPSELDGYKVTEIANYCFSSQPEINTVEIPPSVTAIGSKAFSDCYGLYVANFGLDYYTENEGTQVIGEGAFMNCYGLHTVYFPTALKVIEANAFSDCSALTSVDIPYGTEIVGDSAFADCPALMSVILPTTINELGKDAFDGCSNSMVIYYEGTKDQWDGINKDETDFYDTEVVFLSEGYFSDTREPDDVIEKNGTKGNFRYTVMADGTAELTEYFGIEADVVIPSEINGYMVSKIGPSCFSSNRKICSVEIPSSVKVIGDCFAYCSKLETVTLHEGLEVIETCTFKRCEKLKNITLPSTVVEIGDNAFEDCEALTEIVIHDKALVIGKRAFEGCEKLEKIYLGKNITKIGEYCFKDCKKISRIEIPDGIMSIEKGLFNNCEKLVEVVIPVSVTEIGERVFYGCDDIERILYSGTESEWKNISKHNDNLPLLSIVKIYGYNPETYKPVGPVFSIVLCGILILAAVAVVIVLMCRKTGTCPDCGRKLEENSEFCGWCGKKL